MVVEFKFLSSNPVEVSITRRRVGRQQTEDRALRRNLAAIPLWLFGRVHETVSHSGHLAVRTCAMWVSGHFGSLSVTMPQGPETHKLHDFETGVNDCDHSRFGLVLENQVQVTVQAGRHACHHLFQIMASVFKPSRLLSTFIRQIGLDSLPSGAVRP